MLIIKKYMVFVNFLIVNSLYCGMFPALYAIMFIVITTSREQIIIKRKKLLLSHLDCDTLHAGNEENHELKF